MLKNQVGRRSKSDPKILRSMQSRVVREEIVSKEYIVVEGPSWRLSTILDS